MELFLLKVFLNLCTTFSSNFFWFLKTLQLHCILHREKAVNVNETLKVFFYFPLMWYFLDFALKETGAYTLISFHFTKYSHFFLSLLGVLQIYYTQHRSLLVFILFFCFCVLLLYYSWKTILFFMCEFLWVFILMLLHLIFYFVADCLTDSRWLTSRLAGRWCCQTIYNVFGYQANLSNIFAVNYWFAEDTYD